MSARLRLLVAAAGFLIFATHVWRLPPSLEDIDSINFALGVEHFDVAAHRPHPPGYPVYIALAKGSTAAVNAVAPAAWSRTTRAAAGLSLWSVIAGAFGAWVLTEFWLACGVTPAIAFLASLVAIASPLFWFTTSRPLSDMPGLIVGLAIVTAFIRGWNAWRRSHAAAPRVWLWASLAAGFAIGLRTQTMWMTGPFWCCALIELLRAKRAKDAALVFGSAAVGALLWAVPLVVASGGLGAYLHALTSQGAADFSGIEMLATRPTMALFRLAMRRTFVDPWAFRGFANVVLALAALGIARLAWRDRRVLSLVVLTFVPYLVFHLAFQETATLRYGLPLVVMVAGLAVMALAALGTRVASVGAAAIAVASLVIVQPRLAAYANQPAPVFEALDDMAHQARLMRTAPELDMHIQVWFGGRRAMEWVRPEWDMGDVPRPPAREWLRVVDHWRTAPASPVWFLSELTRNDLSQFDPRATSLVRRYELAPEIRALIGDSRLDSLAWWSIEKPPMWMLGKGWSITPEVAGMTDQDNSGPPDAPADAFVARNHAPMHIVIGGRDVAPGGSPDGLLQIALDGRAIRERRLTAASPWFVEWIDLPDGVPDGPDAYAHMTIQCVPVDAGKPAPEVTLEQFDAAPEGEPIVAYESDWNELEENPASGQLWRWTSESSTLTIRGADRDLDLALTGESPLKNFPQAPTVVVRAGDTEVARFTPSADFTQHVTIPLSALTAAGGRVTISTNKTFSPADRGQGSDRRQLGLKLYRVTVAER